MTSNFLFNIGQNTYALPAAVIQQTLAAVSTRSVPWMPPFHRGLFHLRGEILPLLDIRTFIQEPDLDAETGEIVLIVNSDSFRFGVRAGTPRFISLPPHSFPMHPMASLFPALDASGEVDGRTFTFISPARLQSQIISAMRADFKAAS